MNILPLLDNAIFLRNFREGMRYPKVVSAAVMAALVIALIFMGSYFNSEGANMYGDRHSTTTPWTSNALAALTIFQGVILFLFGTLSAGRMASREKNGGTLDFHRCSPTSRMNQIIGLVVGAPILEWCLFAATLPVAMALVFLANVSVINIAIFYAGLILCAIFMHTWLVLFSLASTQRQSGVGMLLLLLFFGPMIFSFLFSLESSVLYHLTWFPAYGFLWNILFSYSDSSYAFGQNLQSFFGHKMFFLVLQSAVQLPLLAMAYYGIERKITYPERTLFSKAQAAALSLLVLFYYYGSSVSIPATERSQWIWPTVVNVFFYLIVVLGVASTLNATPSYLGYCRGLRRMKKLGLKQLSLEDDHSSNLGWLLTYVMIVSVFYYLFSSVFFVSWQLRLAYYGILVSQIVFFANAWEYFSLSPYHQKKVYFWSGILILWLLLPIAGWVTQPVTHSDLYPQYFCVLSPLWVATIFTTIFSKPAVAFPFLFAVIANVFSAVVAFTLAYAARREAERLNAEN